MLPPARTATAAARRASDDRFLAEVREEFPDLDEAAVAKLAANRRQAHYARMALRSAISRRGKRGARDAT